MIGCVCLPQDGELRSGDMPGGWRSAGGAYKLQYTHPLCADSGVMVIGLAMGPLLALNGEAGHTHTHTHTHTLLKLVNN